MTIVFNLVRCRETALGRPEAFYNCIKTHLNSLYDFNDFRKTVFNNLNKRNNLFTINSKVGTTSRSGYITDQEEDYENKLGELISKYIAVDRFEDLNDPEEEIVLRYHPVCPSRVLPECTHQGGQVFYWDGYTINSKYQSHHLQFGVVEGSRQITQYVCVITIKMNIDISHLHELKNTNNFTNMYFFSLSVREDIFYNRIHDYTTYRLNCTKL